MPGRDRTGPAGYGPMTGRGRGCCRRSMGYYSYGLGQIGLPVVGLPKTAPITNLTSTRPTVMVASVAQPFVPTVMVASVARPVVPTVMTASLAQLKPAQHSVVQMSAEQQAATGRPSVGSQVATGGGGAPPPPAAPDYAAETCRVSGGTHANGVCTLPDGAVVLVQADGTAVCVNAVGQCAAGDAGAGAGAGGGKGTLMLGAAALAALMFLR